MKSSSKPSITIIIPAVNEEKLIVKVIKEALSIKKYDIHPLVIIDSKTTDNTETVAKKAGATVVHLGKGKGKGYAMKHSIKHIKTPYAIQIDADHQFQPLEIPLMMEPLLHGYDVTLGTRYQKGAHIERKSVSYARLFGSYILSLAASIAALHRITDVMAGFKGFKTKVLKDLPITVDHFGYEAELAIRASRKKYNVINIPITYTARREGATNVSSLKHGFLVLTTIIKTALKP